MTPGEVAWILAVACVAAIAMLGLAGVAPKPPVVDRLHQTPRGLEPALYVPGDTNTEIVERLLADGFYYE